MKNTPEGRVIKKEGTRNREDLINAFEKQAASDLDQHDRFDSLKIDISRRLPELVNEDSPADSVIKEIIQKHERTLRNDKGLEDFEEQEAYIIALIRELQKRIGELH